MERFIPVEMFRKNVIPFEVRITFVPFSPKRPEIFVPFVWLTSVRLPLEAKGELNSKGEKRSFWLNSLQNSLLKLCIRFGT